MGKKTLDADKAKYKEQKRKAKQERKKEARRYKEALRKEKRYGTNAEIGWDKLDNTAHIFPVIAGESTMGPLSSILGEMMIVGITADSTSMQDLRTMADWTIRPRLLTVDGVTQVSILGGETKEYQILLNPDKMKHYNVSLNEVMEAVEGMNQNATGDILYNYGNEYIIRGMLSTTDIDKMGKAVVKTDNALLPELRRGAR